MEQLEQIFSEIWVVWLILLFASLIAYAYWPKNKARFAADALIPLRDEDELHEER